MEKIRFEKSFQEASLRNPFQGFQEAHQKIEIRKDPLTGRRCRINIDRAGRPKQVSAKINELDEFIRSSKAKCFFCPENIEEMTPTFTGELPERIKVGEAWLFPNLFPFAGFHAVGVFSGDHYLELSQFTPELIENCIKACLKYLSLVHTKHRKAKYWYINWNYMPPSAASIIHPHVQIVADLEPTQYLRELLESSKSYHNRNEGNYWSDLVEEEKKEGERFIGTSGSVSWLTTFAPQGNREALAIFSNAPSFAELTGGQLAEFCRGLSLILKGYHASGVQSFNMATFSGPCDEDLGDFYLLNLRLMSRPNPTLFYVNDTGFMEKLHQEPIVETIPEYLAEELRRFF